MQPKNEWQKYLMSNTVTIKPEEQMKLMKSVNFKFGVEKKVPYQSSQALITRSQFPTSVYFSKK